MLQFPLGFLTQIVGVEWGDLLSRTIPAACLARMRSSITSQFVLENPLPCNAVISMSDKSLAQRRGEWAQDRVSRLT